LDLVAKDLENMVSGQVCRLKTDSYRSDNTIVSEHPVIRLSICEYHLRKCLGEKADDYLFAVEEFEEKEGDWAFYIEKE